MRLAMTRFFLVAFVLGFSSWSLPGCGSNSGGVEIKTVPPMTAEEKQTMEDYEKAQQEANQAYR